MFSAVGRGQMAQLSGEELQSHCRSGPANRNDHPTSDSPRTLDAPRLAPPGCRVGQQVPQLLVVHLRGGRGSGGQGKHLLAWQQPMQDPCLAEHSGPAFLGCRTEVHRLNPATNPRWQTSMKEASSAYSQPCSRSLATDSRICGGGEQTALCGWLRHCYDNLRDVLVLLRYAPPPCHVPLPAPPGQDQHSSQPAHPPWRWRAG